MEIRRTDDYARIASLNRPVHDLHVTLYPSIFKEYHLESIKAAFQGFMQDEKFIFLLAEDNQEDLGYAWIEIRKNPESVFKKGYQSIFIHQLCLKAEYRKKGYGSKLLQAIYQIAIEKNIKLVELDYWARNDVMLQFCKKQGFQPSREFTYKQL